MPSLSTIGRRYRQHAGVEMRRTTGGVVEMRAADDVALARGLGFAHAHDRLVQMELVRVIGRGRLCECFASNDEALAVDVFMREMGFAHIARADAARCTPEARSVAQAYCDGVNEHLARHRRPLELLLLRHRPAPWTVEDILLTILVMSYVSLAQSQQDMEKWIVQTLHDGVPVARLRELFRPHLDGLDDAIVELVRRTRIEQGLLPPAVRFVPALPRVMASNNWVVAAARSVSGSALSCNDPHLEVNRLPAIWYEWIGHTADDYRMGITMPGVPGLVMGRTRRVAASFTYGFMDQVDYFIEEIRDGRYRRGDGFEDLAVRKERILRKGDEPVELSIRETRHGVLEVDPRRPVADGLVLCRAWSGQHGGAAASLEALRTISMAADVEQAQAAVRNVGISCNWLLADRGGRIAYQQSGRLPARRHSGLFPVPGWTGAYDWDGMIDPALLVNHRDPPDGVLATANHDVSAPGHPAAINLPMGSYREERIRALLGTETRLDLEDMARIQRDLWSLQAERLVSLWKPLLPDTAAARALASWDLRYDAGSVGAPLFEKVYAALLREVFGRGVFGLDAWDATTRETSVLIDFYHLFDRILLEGDDGWFGEGGRDATTRRVLAAELGPQPLATWGEQRQVVMAHVLLGGKLPKWLRVDRGPITLEGGRATVVQGSIYRSHGRLTTFCPSYRCLTDLGTDEMRTALAGGPSGRPLSRLYASGVEGWLKFAYETLSAARGA
ncbi:MAG: penicillin acylase family protein [Deltaproteobacteria bacterium]|nr:penicillin acylase family protein [Deltaproteobacteria bacterium]